MYHPDVSKNPDTEEKFVLATEAYDFLMSYKNRINAKKTINPQAATDWQRRSQENARRKTYTTYAKRPYSTFQKTEFYKTTKVFNAIHTILGFAVSIMILTIAIHGYVYRLRNPIPYVMEKPSLFFFIVMLIIGVLVFVMALGAFLNRKK